MNLANKITVARICLIPLFILSFSQYPQWLADESPFFSFMNQYGINIAIVVFIVASGTDKLDGYIARKYNQITNLGKLLDPLADKLLISVALIMMVQSGMIPSWMAVIIIGREFIITSLRMIASEQGIALAADHFGKIKMVMQVVAIAAILLDNYPFDLLTSIKIDYFLMLIAVGLTVFSGFNYIIRNFKTLRLGSMK
ncbi:CDP-diacylglycerol--glycerol-3-phosphate 3-phosphatidyltransferase [Paenibacillus macquariensis]|uniref:CDP-diacylglycerol--glycerol-3-phosphate 3-phosphatidyltransferase n=1 Tax=Paenibacillus macquariensis TaxID=948756 RepID=A0ABY1KAX1_9BACL|nr:CDP-diacylglycerol--glycerol-3-phosphate 3-phosphatidyltransferase [Paenibacillus macquariensis]MEC0089505.1 CDP-diacylglycerol--glycerol-3-phosphate 3-phosphatidyltransferase [Paenibacillus macquariensis]OAB25823.1 CDP-diacylglycerol--glycerol-3-phosphate 3-phosphatidyltransferase [Paenibacillus macquariensis subsp. macquariensis]SIR52936.1 CDP-diacylglycerol--glycerol-3-phosphate 3-phosphatidyltransferase [Paenibacillus macquariensis]